jgi:hypothetical protein
MTPLPLEAQFSTIASYIALVIEAGAVFVVSYGAIQAIAGVVGGIFNRGAGEMQGRQIWLRFATWDRSCSGLSLPSPPTSCARR